MYHFDQAACALPATTADRPDWHRGRTRYGLWMLTIDDPAIHQRWQSAHRHLTDYLLPAPQRQPHISLFVCGFPGTQRQWDDDFPHADLAQQKARLQAARLPPFELRIGGLDSFASAAFLQVQDPQDRLAGLRSALACIPEIRFAPFVPHLTVGLYARSLPVSSIRSRLQTFADTKPLALTVRELCFATYAARDLDSPLQVEYRQRLDE